MIVYQSCKSAFCSDVATGRIDQIILERMRGRLGRGAAATQIRAWHQSLTHMHLVLASTSAAYRER
jgi:hypothetical protein